MPGRRTVMENDFAGVARLTGRVALIAGGTGGLGEPVTRAFLGAGATVIVSSSSERHDLAARLESESGVPTGRLSALKADATQEEQVERLVQIVLDRYGRLDIAVNLIGGWSAGQPVTETPVDTWDTMLNLNLRTAVLIGKYAARPMVRQQWGRIIHTSSRAARSGRRNAAAYAVAKNAVVALTEIQAEELRDDNVTVNAILPSIIDTPANRHGMPDADFTRWPKADDIARILLFLASDDAQLISGAAIPVYGRA